MYQHNFWLEKPKYKMRFMRYAHRKIFHAFTQARIFNFKVSCIGACYSKSDETLSSGCVAPFCAFKERWSFIPFLLFEGAKSGGNICRMSVRQEDNPENCLQMLRRTNIVWVGLSSVVFIIVFVRQEGRLMSRTLFNVMFLKCWRDV